MKFVIVGDGRNKENFLAEINRLDVQDKFIMIDRQPQEKIPEFLACCDAAFVSFMDNELFTKQFQQINILIWHVECPLLHLHLERQSVL